MITRFKIRKRIKPFSNRPNFKIFRWSKKKRVCYYAYVIMLMLMLLCLCYYVIMLQVNLLFQTKTYGVPCNNN